MSLALIAFSTIGMSAVPTFIYLIMTEVEVTLQGYIFRSTVVK
jgi:hypothetical protein